MNASTTFAPRSVALQRRSKLSKEAFAAEFLAGEGCPVLVTDACAAWPALQEWSFERLKARYGQEFVSVSVGLCTEFGKTTKFSEFLDYLDAPEAGLKGFWTRSLDSKPMKEAPVADSALHYLLDWSAFQRHPEMERETRPLPYFVEDWGDHLEPTLRAVFEWTSAREYSSVYVGPAGTFSELHQDFGDTYACLSQICGRKHVRLLPPRDTSRIQDAKRAGLGEESLEGVDWFEGVIEPGETLFIPPNWWHNVRALEKSITVSRNFYSASNFNAHLKDLLRKLPRLLKGLREHPEWREALGIDWEPPPP